MNMNINPMQFMQQLNQLKSKGGDPNQMIQNMLNTGRVSQSQYNNAVRLAQQIQQMLTPGAHK